VAVDEVVVHFNGEIPVCRVVFKVDNILQRFFFWLINKRFKVTLNHPESGDFVVYVRYRRMWEQEFPSALATSMKVENDKWGVLVWWRGLLNARRHDPANRWPL